jgi:lactate dehydrogenase-like 2-hydroxyacid dehydrogenase
MKPPILQMGAYPGWDQTPLDAAYTVHRYDKAPDKAAFLAEVGPHIRAIATSGGLGASAAVIAACPNLEIISIYGVGFDAVDMPAARARGIHVTNTPDVLTDDVADLAIGMLIAASRNIPAADQWARSGNWATKGAFPLQRKVTGLRIGILGLGRIGMAIAERLIPFKTDIAYSATAPKAVPWTYIHDPVELAARSDVLILALAASPTTRHIVNAEVLNTLGPQGLLINISRAANIDEDALLTALESRTLGYAALDVFEGEPQLNPRFTTLPNVLLQPHHASATTATRRAMGQLMRDNLTAHFAGQPLLTPVL